MGTYVYNGATWDRVGPLRDIHDKRGPVGVAGPVGPAGPTGITSYFGMSGGSDDHMADMERALGDALLRRDAIITSADMNHDVNGLRDMSFTVQIRGDLIYYGGGSYTPIVEEPDTDEPDTIGARLEAMEVSLRLIIDHLGID